MKKENKKIINKVPVDYYDKTSPLQKIWHRRKLTSFKSLISDENFENILDVGCAGGTLTNKFSKVLNGKITAIDPYTKAIKYAEKKYPQINFVTADAHKLPFKNNQFDLIVSYETVEHLEDPLKALKEIKRVLKPKGKAIIAMDSGSLLFRTVWFFWERSKGNVWQGAHLHPYHHDELEDVIKNAGLKILDKQFTHLGMEVTFVLTK